MKDLLTLLILMEGLKVIVMMGIGSVYVALNIDKLLRMWYYNFIDEMDGERDDWV